jgi:general secretion pathway protein B
LSYILDALRRADAERGLGHVPTLQTQATPLATTDEGFTPARGWRWAVAGLVLVVMSLAAWWMLGRGPSSPNTLAQTSPPQVLSVAQAPPPVQPPPQAAPALAPAAAAMPPSPAVATPTTPAPVGVDAPALAGGPAAPSQTKQSAQAADSVAVAGATASIAEPTQPVKTPATAVSTLRDKPVPTLSELPESVRRELPTLSVGGAMHSSNAASRMLILNGQVFQEGDAVTPDLVLEQINLKSAVLVYKGQRYSISY